MGEGVRHSHLNNKRELGLLVPIPLPQKEAPRFVFYIQSIVLMQIKSNQLSSYTSEISQEMGLKEKCVKWLTLFHSICILAYQNITIPEK